MSRYTIERVDNAWHAAGRRFRTRREAVEFANQQEAIAQEQDRRRNDRFNPKPGLEDVLKNTDSHTEGSVHVAEVRLAPFQSPPHKLIGTVRWFGRYDTTKDPQERVGWLLVDNYGREVGWTRLKHDAIWALRNWYTGAEPDQ